MEKIIQVKVIPKAKEPQVIKDLKGNLKVKVKSPPVAGKANKELIQLLSKYYNVSPTQISIIKGLMSRQKIIRLVF